MSSLEYTQCRCPNCVTPRVDLESEASEGGGDFDHELGGEVTEWAEPIMPRFVHLADAAISSGRANWSPGSVLSEALAGLDGNTVFPSPAELFEMSRGGEGDGRFVVVGAPGGLLLAKPRPGDVICRVGEGGLSHVSIIAGSDYWPREQLGFAGLIPESHRPGIYVQVVEGGAFPHTSADQFARLLTDCEGRLPLDQTVLRPELIALGRSDGVIDSELNGTPPASIRSDPEYKRWIQQSLNQVDAAQLVIDGILGSKSVGAIRQFQRRRGLVVDGIVGPITERELINAGAPQPPPLGGTPPAPPSNEPRIDPRDERVDVSAKFALQRMVKRSDMRADAIRLIEGIHSGKLAGIFGDDLQAAVRLAQRHGTQRWLLVPQGEDAALVLDPAEPLTALATVIFRRLTRNSVPGEPIHPGRAVAVRKGKEFGVADPLTGQAVMTRDLPPERLDAALQKASQTFELWRTGQLNRCELPTPIDPVVFGASVDTETVIGPLANIFPPIFCQLGSQPPSPPSPALVTHMHVRRTCATPPNWVSDADPIALTAGALNPGFINSSDQINFDATLDAALVNLMVTKYPRLLDGESVRTRSPNRADKIRVALVDLTGNKLCNPGFAGWGSTQIMAGGSTAKIGLFYAAHQIVFDMQQLARSKGIRTKSDFFREADDSLKNLPCKPDLKWLLKLDESANPIGVEQSADLAGHLLDIVEERNSTGRASEVIMRLGFDYMASLFLQSGLRHPTRAGLWLGGTYCTGKTAAPLNTKCHALQDCGPKDPKRIIWTTDPLGIKSISLTALSAATFFTLLAQGRLVTAAASSKIEFLLKRACAGFQTVFRAGVPGARIRAEKCGLTSTLLHEAALVENGTRRYVVVYLTERANLSDGERTQLAKDLDQLITANNP